MFTVLRSKITTTELSKIKKDEVQSKDVFMCNQIKSSNLQFSEVHVVIELPGESQFPFSYKSFLKSIFLFRRFHRSSRATHDIRSTFFNLADTKLLLISVFVVYLCGFGRD